MVCTRSTHMKLNPVKWVENILVRGKRMKVRSRPTWADQLSSDMRVSNLTGDITLDKNDLRQRIRVVETQPRVYKGLVHSEETHGLGFVVYSGSIDSKETHGPYWLLF